MADVKSLSVLFPALHQKPFIQQCPIHQQSHSMEAWQEFGKPLAGDYFMFGLLVPASNVTWQVSAQPCSYQSQLTCINSYITCLQLSSAAFLLHCISLSSLQHQQWPVGFEVVLNKSTASLKGHKHLVSEGSFPSWAMSNKNSMRERHLVFMGFYSFSFVYIFLGKCAQCYS